jgi:hypothetical protein
MLRKKSYPFDWTTHEEQLHDTNILYNIELIQRLDNIDQILKEYISPTITKNDRHICFPHEHGTQEEIVAKYKRRFDRLKEDLHHVNTSLLY